MNRWMNATLPAAALGLVLAASQAHAGPKDDALLTAVKNRDAAAVKGLVTGGANPNFVFQDHSVALSWAVNRIDPDSVKALLAAGADPNVKDLDGANPLVLACETGENVLINQLLDAKADVNFVRFDGATPLHICARTSSPAVVARMLAAGAKVEVANAEGQTPLMFAAAAGRADNIVPLVKGGAKVDAATKKGFTPLLFAVNSGSEPAVRALLDSGAGVNYVSPAGKMPLSPEGVNALQLSLYGYLAPGQGQNDSVDRIAVAKTLVQAGASLTGWDDIGRQPIHAAVIAGDIELVKMMLAKGADPNALSRLPYMLDPTMDNSNSGAKTPPPPLDLAALGYRPRIMVNKNGGAASLQAPPAASTPLLFAAQLGNTELMKVLVAAGAKPDFTTADKNNVVMAAAGSGKFSAVEYAVSLYPKLDAVKEDGSSLMHVALGNARSPEMPQIVRYLADKGAPLDIRNKRGQTPSDATQRAAPAVKALFAEVLKAHPLATASTTGGPAPAGPAAGRPPGAPAAAAGRAPGAPAGARAPGAPVASASPASGARIATN